MTAIAPQEMAMQFNVLIEPIEGNGYQASTGDPLRLVAHGATRDEALTRVRELVQSKLAGGSEIVALTVPAPQNPWVRMAGMLDPHDPVVKEWLQIMEENRRLADEDPNWP
jgi:predicted RNase H-like HicB family nuclease